MENNTWARNEIKALRPLADVFNPNTDTSSDKEIQDCIYDPKPRKITAPGVVI